MLIDNVWVYGIHGNVKKEIKPLAAHKKNPAQRPGKLEKYIENLIGSGIMLFF